MKKDTRILTEVDRTKQLINYTTKPKKKIIPEVTEKTEETIEEGKIVTLTEFMKG